MLVRFLVVLLAFFSLTPLINADEVVSQKIALNPGWNIVSTPMVLSSHSFSATETSENFDIYILDASKPTGWATMSDLGQTEFIPLHGYFINNKTNNYQTLTFNYDTTLEPNQKLFERTFTTEGWYSIGVANAEYAKTQRANREDTNNPSKILNLLAGKYDLLIDFTNAVYQSDRKSVALTDPWKASVLSDIDKLNDFRDTKGYAIYVKEVGTRYNGFQNDPVAENVGPDQLIIKESSSNPDGMILSIDDDYEVNPYFMPIFAFDLNSSNSANDIILNKINVRVALDGNNYASVVDGTELVIDGVVINNYTASTSSNGLVTDLTFSVDGDFIVRGGENVTAELGIKFKDLEFEGTTITASVDSSVIEAVVAEDISIVQLSGSAMGNVHTLRKAGIIVALESVDADVTTADGSANDYATYVIEVEITALGQDAYIAVDDSISIDWALKNGSGLLVTIGTTTSVLISTADEDSNYFQISEGNTETLTLVATFSPGVTNTSARLQLSSIGFASTPIAPTQTWVASPDTDYRTAVVTIVN